MFWESALAGTDIYSLIGRDPPPTLDEVLIEEGIIQEVRSRDSRIIEFFTRDCHVSSLIHYVTLDEVDTTGSTSAYRIPYVCSEILSSGISEVYLKLCEFKNLVSLFGVFRRLSVNFIICNFIMKIMSSLLISCPGKMYDYICENQDVVICNLFNHIENSSVVEFLTKMFSPDMNEYQMPFIKLLRSQKLIERIYDVVTPSSSQIVLTRVNFLFYELLRIARVKIMQTPEDQQWLLSELVEDAQTDANLEKLIENMFVREGFSDTQRFDAVSTGCNILLCLYDLSRVGDIGGDEFIEAGNINLCFNLTISTDFVLIASKVPMFVGFLNDMVNYKDISPAGLSVLLLAVRFMAACALHNVSHLNKALTGCMFFQYLLDAFVRYPYYNLLHDVITNLFNSILQGHFYCYVSNYDTDELDTVSGTDQKSGNDSLLSENAYLQFYLIDDARITRFLLGLVKKTKNSLVGYEGHLFELMEQMSVFTSDVLCPVGNLSEICTEHGPEGEVLADFGNEDCDVCHRACWDAYMETTLEEYKLINEVCDAVGKFDLSLYGDQLDVFYASQNMSNMSPAIMKQKMEAVTREALKGFDAMDLFKKNLNVKVPLSFVSKPEKQRNSAPLSSSGLNEEKKNLQATILTSSKTQFLEKLDDFAEIRNDKEDNEISSKSEVLPDLSKDKMIKSNINEKISNPFTAKELIKPVNSNIGGDNNSYINNSMRKKIAIHGEMYLGEEFVYSELKNNSEMESVQPNINHFARTLHEGSGGSDVGKISEGSGDDMNRNVSSDSVFSVDVAINQGSDDDDIPMNVNLEDAAIFQSISVNTNQKGKPDIEKNDLSNNFSNG